MVTGQAVYGCKKSLCGPGRERVTQHRSVCLSLSGSFREGAESQGTEAFSQMSYLSLDQ